MAGRLEDKVAIVTGAGTGIGRAIAVLFGREGARTAVCGRTRRTLEDTARQTESDVAVFECDVSNADDVNHMVAGAVERFGRIDILVNNAGIRASIGTILDLSEQEWQRTLDIDAKGSWLCSKSVVPRMRETGGGSIIMVSSISAHIGQVKQGAYNAAKGAQEMLMRCMALDFASDNIRVNSICPAWVETEMNRTQLQKMRAEPERAFPPGVTYADVVGLHPLGRLGTPEDVAWAAVYLASGEAGWVTGTSLFVDGGYTCC